ncbi:hypothetical protein D3C73_435780 [compost metagenome]
MFGNDATRHRQHVPGRAGKPDIELLTDLGDIGFTDLARQRHMIAVAKHFGMVDKMLADLAQHLARIDRNGRAGEDEFPMWKCSCVHDISSMRGENLAKKKERPKRGLPD